MRIKPLYYSGMKSRPRDGLETWFWLSRSRLGLERKGLVCIPSIIMSKRTTDSQRNNAKFPAAKTTEWSASKTTANCCRLYWRVAGVLRETITLVTVALAFAIEHDRLGISVYERTERGHQWRFPSSWKSTKTNAYSIYFIWQAARRSSSITTNIARTSATKTSQNTTELNSLSYNKTTVYYTVSQKTRH